MACDVYGNLLKDCCHVMWQLSLRMNDGKQQFGGNKMGVGAYKSSVQAPFLWKCRRRNSAVFDENFRQVGRVYSNLYMGMSLVYAFWRKEIGNRIRNLSSLAVTLRGGFLLSMIKFKI